AHSDLDPRQSIPNKWETYTLNVPTETEVPTVRVRLLVPREFEIEMLEHSQIWQITKERDERGYIREVTWQGSTIPPQTFTEFKLLVRNPVTPGTYVWKIEQYYEDGTMATWEAPTQIVPVASAGGVQRAEEAWRAAQVATTVSLVALGIAVLLIIVTVIGIMQGSRGRAREPS
ncbi:MAG: YcnI family protein, partial [candidate division KSB1 bacterium]|nr:YcnI family protein [candidate division KSB1 bacterium]